MQFRQKALAKLQSPEELDLPVRYARPQGRLILAVTVLAMAAACFWAVTGTVSSKLSAPAVLTHAQGSYMLQSPVSGQVTQVLAKEGQMVRAGTPVLRLRTERGYRAVRAVATGRVTTLVAKIGSVVTTGRDVATVERISHPGEPLVALAYVPAKSASTVTAGSPVDLSVQSVPAQQYGVLKGKVKSVGSGPQSRQQIAGFLGDQQLAGRLSAQGSPVPVVVELERKGSGYAWSTKQGPPKGPESMTPADAALHLPPQRPIDWLLP
ncbi:HlyD family efflux transporter periplasmic adaptor subunit [Streptomyces sp. ODS28]|uniref:HlyD family efflux transporter periplasmic adaptor subunit n=1 Tax=Streptomyces sp. ODS28 TaxID=3136688 RepID=UPI0031EDF378